jgi:hypothetical protein
MYNEERVQKVDSENKNMKKLKDIDNQNRRLSMEVEQQLNEYEMERINRPPKRILKSPDSYVFKYAFDKPKVSFTKTRKRVFNEDEPSITVSRIPSYKENIPKQEYTIDSQTKSSTTKFSGEKFGSNPSQSDIDKYYSKLINKPGLVARKKFIERELLMADSNIIDRIIYTLENCLDGAFKGTIFDVNFGGGDQIDINEFYNELEKKYSETDVNRIKTLFEKTPELQDMLKNNQCPINDEAKNDALEIYKILLTGKKYVVKGGRHTRKNRKNKSNYYKRSIRNNRKKNTSKRNKK